MARFEAFTALAYDPRLVRAEDVLAPPYDVVGPTERAVLAAKSDFNAIHVELPEPDEAAGIDRYEHAARLLQAWSAEGAVRRDHGPGLYVYRMGYDDEQRRRRTTTGVLGALGLDPDERGEVLPHEQIMAKDMQDRLSLLRACKTNLSPIWGLSLAKGLSASCVEAAEAAEAAGRRPFAATIDGVEHEAWPVHDPALVAAIGALAATAPVLIADGHHRYATACAYAAETRAGNGDRPGGHDLVLTFLVELSEDELAVRPIHRLLVGLDPATVPELFARWFEVSEAPGEDTELVAAMARTGALGLVTSDATYLLQPKATLRSLADDDLDSSLLRAALDTFPPHGLAYQPGLPAARAEVGAGRAVAAVLLNPVTVAQIERVAEGGRRMQPKSTYFYPKPRTGMAFRPLE